MIEIFENFDLKGYNTFALNCQARYLSFIHNERDIQDVLDHELSKHGLFILGGGSNVLFVQNVEQWTLINQIKGRKVLAENENYVTVEVAAGEVWHEFVLYAVNNHWGGIENLALIPGTVGAAPIQNIGAYGVEVKEVIYEVKGRYLDTGKAFVLSNSECKFDYRNSVFKQELKNKVIITSVVFKLSKQHNVQTNYGVIQQVLRDEGIQLPTIKNVAEAVIKIRNSKLPNPSILPNAGSFFKNPVIMESDFLQLLKQYPEIPHYKILDSYKIPAAWLIEQAGWKGKKEGLVGVHKNQALVIVNYGEIKGEMILKLSEKIIASVLEKFNIILEREVSII